MRFPVAVRFWFPAVLCAIVLLAEADASAFTCGSRTVSIGDTKAEVLVKCGEPAGKESREEELRERLENGTKKTIIAVDEWIYNFGPQSFLRILQFRDGTLADIRTGQYGYGEGEGAGLSCDEHSFNVGDTKVDVLMRCGEPFWKDQRTEELVDRQDSAKSRKTTVLVEEWTYNLGPSTFMRILTFRNGVVSDVRAGEYGR